MHIPSKKVSRRKAEKSLRRQDERGRPVWFAEAESQQHLGSCLLYQLLLALRPHARCEGEAEMYRRGAKKKKKIREMKNRDATRDFRQFPPIVDILSSVSPQRQQKAQSQRLNASVHIAF